jgi:hypothetical protein
MNEEEEEEWRMDWLKVIHTTTAADRELLLPTPLHRSEDTTDRKKGRCHSLY